MAQFVRYGDTIRIIHGDQDYVGFVDRLACRSDGQVDLSLVGVRPTEKGNATSYGPVDPTDFVREVQRIEAGEGPAPTPGGDAMNREQIQRQIDRTSDTYTRELDRLQAQLAELDRYGDDPFEDGDVLVFHKTFTHVDAWDGRTRTSKPYFYAATRASGLWNTTGPKSPKAYTWYDLRKWIDDGGTVDGIWYVDTLKPIEER
jgi:hypothetical protein